MRRLAHGCSAVSSQRVLPVNDALLLAREGQVLTVTFNRPDRLNAFRKAEYHALHRLLTDVRRDASVRVVVLTGAGRAFCAGEDLKELDASPATEAQVRAEVEVLQDITRQIAASDQVYVAAVNGVAAGFGAELSIACDLRIAASSARFVFPEVRRGLFVTNGVTLLLPRIVGATWAAHLFLSGLPIDAATAQHIGLVTEVVADDMLAPRGRDLAQALIANAPTAMVETKRMVRGSDRALLEQHLTSELEAIVRCFRSGEYVEGARAFVEKRQPRWADQ